MVRFEARVAVCVPGHNQFLSALRRAAVTDTAADQGGALLFVHAGVDPTRPLDAQGDAFWWGGNRLPEMAAPYAGFRRVIRGFDRKHGGLIVSPYVTSLDAGSGFGGELLAVCFAADGTVSETLSA